MKTLTAANVGRILQHLHTIETFTTTLRGCPRQLPVRQLYLAADAVERVREMLFEVAIGDVGIEAVEVERAA